MDNGKSVQAAQTLSKEEIRIVCKSDSPQCLKLAMMKVFKVDKVACLKHLAAKEGVVVSYRSRTEEARRSIAAKMKFDDGKGQEQWYEGVISSYNMITGKHSIYFPSDGLTEKASLTMKIWK